MGVNKLEDKMAQFRKDKSSDQWIVLASMQEAEDAKSNGNIVTVTTKDGKQQLRHIAHWSRAFETEEGMARYGYPCGNKREDQPQQAQSVDYSQEPF